MILGIEVWVTLGVTAILVALALAKLARVETDLEQAVLVLRRVNIRATGNLLGPDQEAIMRRDLSARAYAEAQAKRMESLREQLLRIFHNAAVLLHWAALEKRRSRQKHPGQLSPSDKLILVVMQSSAAVRRDALFAIVKVTIWRGLRLAKWRIIPSLSLSDLKERNGRDIMAAYEELTSAAAEVVLSIRPERYEEFVAAL